MHNTMIKLSAWSKKKKSQITLYRVPIPVFVKSWSLLYQMLYATLQKVKLLKKNKTMVASRNTILQNA